MPVSSVPRKSNLKYFGYFKRCEYLSEFSEEWKKLKLIIFLFTWLHIPARRHRWYLINYKSYWYCSAFLQYLYLARPSPPSAGESKQAIHVHQKGQRFSGIHQVLSSERSRSQLYRRVYKYEFVPRVECNVPSWVLMYSGSRWKCRAPSSSIWI